jgi:Protein of unknown function (DUF3037)
MQENHLFEYAVIRVVPRVEREEFLNAGVIVYCRKPAFLQMIFQLDEKRLQSIYPEVDIKDVLCHLQAFEQICSGSPKAGPIAALDAASRFRWLTAKRSTVIQSSPVHPGLCKDPSLMLNRLFEQLVAL